MTLVAECPNCGRKLNVPESVAGKRGRCPKCGAIVDIPSLPEEAGFPHLDLDEEDASPGNFPPNPSGSNGTAANQQGIAAPPIPPAPTSPGKAANQTPVAPATPAVKATPNGITTTQGYIIIVLVLIGLGAPVFGSLRPTPKWDYRIESPSDKLFESEIKRLGDEGWELVTARRATSDYSGPSYEMIFKRPK